MSNESKGETLLSLLGDQTPSSEVSPASRGLSLGDTSESTTLGTYGLITFDLFKSCDHAGYSVRTCPVCWLRVPTQSLPIWKQRATPVGRLFWVLMTSGHHIDESEFFFSLDSLTDYDEDDSLRPQRPQRHRNWPTSVATDFKGISGTGRQERKGFPADTLPNAVHLAEGRTWPSGQHAPDNPSTTGNPPELFRLNPAWVCQLMGFPKDWFDGVAKPKSTGEGLSKDSATQSHPPSQKLSDEQSSTPTDTETT